ncbi:hypothetical protein HU175_12735 [Spirosoma sp. KUDC1026]|nr:hypothetical protein HU175_12735 [Spirosoma sp. KUDC1026]
MHYSRFYHVLESIARNEMVDVSGIGRYPAPEKRPKSEFSMKSKSGKALENIFSIIASRKASAIITFPANAASNGLSGAAVEVHPKSVPLKD